MSKVLVNETSLTAIANAIRAKNGETTTYKPAQMATAITNLPTGSPDIPDSAFNKSGNLDYVYCNGQWDWFLNTYGDKITASAVSSCSHTFYNSYVQNIPFYMYFPSGWNDGSVYGINVEYMFANCTALESLPELRNIQPNTMEGMLWNCLSLTDISTLYDANYMYLSNCAYLFQNCYALREINSELFENLQLADIRLLTDKTLLNRGFSACISLDELIDVPVDTYTDTITSNMFLSPFSNCCRLKNLTFHSTTGTVNWSNQNINLSDNVGYSDTGEYYETYLKNFGGFTDSTRITNDTNYQTLKNNYNSWTTDVAYSRYNKDSAIATINSLPTTTGTSNIIKFMGNSGSKTDGGAINTMTAEEIAVATAKGFTVSFV